MCVSVLDLSLLNLSLLGILCQAGACSSFWGEAVLCSYVGTGFAKSRMVGKLRLTTKLNRALWCTRMLTFAHGDGHTCTCNNTSIQA